MENNKLQVTSLNRNRVFEDLKSKDEGGEYWYARDLQKTFGYLRWDTFCQAIERAKKSFKTSTTGNYYEINDHFRKVRKMVQTGSGAERAVDDYKLSRYACYLIAQNGDPSKEPIALAQAYFNIQTFRQEFNDQMEKDRARLERRKEFTESDKRLSKNIAEMGISSRGIVVLAGKTLANELASVSRGIITSGRYRRSQEKIDRECTEEVKTVVCRK